PGGRGDEARHDRRLPAGRRTPGPPADVQVRLRVPAAVAAALRPDPARVGLRRAGRRRRTLSPLLGRLHRTGEGGDSGMGLALNRRALELADAMAAEAEGLRIRVTRLGNGTRVVDCGVEVEGGLEAGRRLAEICLGGRGAVSFTTVEVGGLWL